MAFLLERSHVPLQFDSLPAVKCTHWQGGAHRVYTLARLYLLKGNLQINLTAYEKDAPNSSHIAFAMAFGQCLVVVDACKSMAQIYTFNSENGCFPSLLSLGKGKTLACQNLADENEQGWFWGQNTSVPKSFFSQVGINFEKESCFKAGLLKYGQNVLGASHKIPVLKMR